MADGGVDTLPATVDGRPGFDAAAVSHLRDVRRVLDRGAGWSPGVLAALVAVWLGVHIARRAVLGDLGRLLRGSGVCAVIVVLGAVARDA